jgi:hypothetical protein
MITDKQISKISQVLKMRISDLQVQKFQDIKKVDLPLNNELYLEMVSLLKSKILEYKIERVITLTHTQVERILKDILNFGKFISIRINKTYKSIIIQKSLEGFVFTRYKKSIIYLKPL